jgi:hypothetical protein
MRAGGPVACKGRHLLVVLPKQRARLAGRRLWRGAAGGQGVSDAPGGEARFIHHGPADPGVDHTDSGRTMRRTPFYHWDNSKSTALWVWIWRPMIQRGPDQARIYQYVQSDLGWGGWRMEAKCSLERVSPLGSRQNSSYLPREVSRITETSQLGSEFAHALAYTPR